jgi:hypothetical protein
MKPTPEHNQRMAKMSFAIEDPLTKQVRYLDKLVDELAKGRKIEKILRTS